MSGADANTELETQKFWRHHIGGGAYWVGRTAIRPFLALVGRRYLARPLFWVM